MALQKYIPPQEFLQTDSTNSVWTARGVGEDGTTREWRFSDDGIRYGMKASGASSYTYQGFVRDDTQLFRFSNVSYATGDVRPSISPDWMYIDIPSYPGYRCVGVTGIDAGGGNNYSRFNIYACSVFRLSDGNQYIKLGIRNIDSSLTASCTFTFYLLYVRESNLTWSV